jgi:hypothetical protein
MTPGGGAYVITVVGELSPSLRAAFDDVEVSVGHSLTHLRLASSDPSVLHGVIHRVESLGLELLDVQREDDTQGGLPP